MVFCASGSFPSPFSYEVDSQHFPLPCSAIFPSRARKQESRRKLWASTYLLAGIRFKPEIAGKLLEKAVAQMNLRSYVHDWRKPKSPTSIRPICGSTRIARRVRAVST